jgi:mRNA interferase RelE/StbE
MVVNFRIFETDQFQKDLDNDKSGMGNKIRNKLLAYVYPQLKANPFFGKNIKKLVDYDPPTWRYRIGDNRYFYIVDQSKKTVIMISADNRKDAY